MPASCVIPDCNLKYTHSGDVSFHKFPLKHPELLKQWIEFAGRDESWLPTKWSAVCSRHFVESDFKDCPLRKMLLPVAVPTIRKVKEKECRVVDSHLATPYETIPTEEIPCPDDEQLHEEIEVSSVTQCPVSASENVDDELQDEEIQLIEITCRVCGEVLNRAVGNALLDLSQSTELVTKYLPFVNLELPNLPRKICMNCSKIVNNFAKFCDNVLRAQTELEHRFGRIGSPTQTATTTRLQPETVSHKSMNIKQEPITMLHIKEEKIESATGGSRQKDSERSSETFENSPLIIKNQSTTGDQNRIILINVGNERSNDTITPSIAKQQQFRDSSKNCEILEIVNLYPPIVDITSTTIRELQPYDITLPPTIPLTNTDPVPSIQQPSMATHFMSGLKVEKMTEQELEEDDYYLRDTLAFANTLEEHSYTKLPIQADDNKDDVFHTMSDTNTCAELVTILEERKSNIVNSFSWICADCWCKFPSRRRLLCHTLLECAARRRLTVGCNFCRRKFPTWPRARAHVAMCLKRVARRKRCTIKAILDRSKKTNPPAEPEKPSNQEEEFVITRYTCSMCDRSYSNTSNLRRHLLSHRPPEQWNHKCGVCQKVFDKLFDLKRHLQISPCANSQHVVTTDDVSSSVSSEQPEGVAFSSSVISTTNPSTERLLYVCSTCNKHFRSYNNLKVHEPIHTGLKAFICEACGKSFTGQTNLWQHRLTHSELRQFRCNQCPKVFKRRGGLSQHVRSFHMKIKPYRCATCGYEYALKADMTRCRHSKLKDLESC
ncbi:zinc finger protein 358 [Anopheles sinensis]|uniref:Zinc finger protein 358 n=1 Tax=Anopheles sinensis TaxID=74873 RepID=A0A084VPC6_ANOSI|nr:zinc finger protein 358 [Anopheles sinensis]